MRTFHEIREMAFHLQNNRSALVKHMMEIKRHYEADWVIPLPDVKGEPNMDMFTPSLITDTVDGLGMRAASISPTTFCPPVTNSVLSSSRATTRRKILHGTYHQNSWKVKRRRYYRHMCAYDTGSIYIRPDFGTGEVRMEVRDPLFTFPEPTSAEQIRAPEYVAFITRHSGSELRRMYPQCRAEAGGPVTETHLEQAWDVFEWISATEMVFGLLGPAFADGDHVDSNFVQHHGGAFMQLGPVVPNRAEMPLAITPQEVSLHSVGTRLNALLGNVQMQSRLMALEVMAQQKAIFPDMYVLGADNQTPNIGGDGQWKDGTTGAMNLLSGVQSVGQITQTPDIRTQAMIDRLERNTRVSSGLNPQMGGESFGSLRTGRALDSMLSSSVDPRIQELHEVTEAWFSLVNESILGAYKGWFSDTKYEFFSGWHGDKGMVKFTPATDIEIVANVVEYSIPGADVVQQTQVLGSLLGAGVISEETFRLRHPYIDDSTAESEQIVLESVHKAMVAGMQEQIASGQMPASIVARLYDKLQDGKPLNKALLEVDEEVRAEQAQAAQDAQAGADPMAAAGNPLAQLGLAAGPAAAGPAALPPGAAGPPAAPGGGGPEAGMAAMLQAAMAGGA